MTAEPSTARELKGRRAVRDVAAQLVLRVANLGLGIAVTVLLVRGLGDEGFGQWSTVFAVSGILGYFNDLGLEQAAVRQAAADPERRNEWIGALLGLRLLLAVPVALAAAAVVLAIADGEAMRTTGVLAAAVIVVGGAGALRGLFQVEVRNDVPASYDLVNGLIWAAAVVILYAQDAGMVAYAVAFLGAAVITTGGVSLHAIRRFGLTLKGTRARWGVLLRVGLPVGVSTLLIVAYGRIDQVLVYELAGDRAAGLYGAAYRILERAQLLPGAVMATLFPVLAAAHRVDPDRMRAAFRVGGEVLLIGSLPFVAFTAVAGGPALELLFGEEFAPAGRALAVLMAAFALVCIGFLAGFTVVVCDLQRRFVRYAFVGLVFNVGANLLLVPRYGFEAAAWITLATEVVVLTPTFRDIFREIGFTVPYGRLARILAASGLLAVLLVALDALEVPLGGLVAATALAYPALVLGLRAAELGEIRALVRP